MSLSLEVIEDLKNEWLRELPSGWRFSRFGDVLEIKRRPIEVQDHVEYLQPVIRRGHGGIEVRERQLGASIKTKAQFLLRAGDWLMSKVQILHRAYGLVPCELDKAIASGSYYAFKIHEDIDPKYLWYLSHANAFHKSCELSSVGVVIEKMVFRASDWLDFEFPLPPLHEQRRIAEILSSVDEAIAATRAVIEQTRKVKQGVLERLLTKGIGHTRFKQTEIGEIPEGWETRALGDLAEFVNGRGFKPEEWSETGLPIIRIQNLNGGSEFNYFNGTYHPKLKVEQGDLLFAWSGSRGTSFGPHIWNGPKGLLNYHTWRVAVGSPKDRDFLYFALLAITKKIERDSHGASALVHMQKAYVVDYLIPYPPENERASICKILSEIDRSINLQATELERLISIKSALMSDLLTGRKRVTDALPMAAE